MNQESLPCKMIPVSIVMPAWNAEKTIGQAIQSVMDQTHENFELIVVDDGSDDGTLSIAKAYSERDCRIRVLENTKNLGVSQSRNNGVQAARYDWIAFLDSDDLWEATMLETQVRTILRDSGCSICFTGSAFMNERGEKYGYTLSVPERMTYRSLLKQNLITCSSVLVKKEALLRHPMHNDPLIHEDFALWLQILREEPYAVGINEPLVIYRLSKSSKSGSKLRAAKMQWRTYRYIGLRPMSAIAYFVIYANRNLHKYLGILLSVQRDGVKNHDGSEKTSGSHAGDVDRDRSHLQKA